MSISVIIPTLNEAGCIAAAIASVRNSGPAEIVVVDGGSSDETRERAGGADRLVSSPAGRARQMNTGARQASGDVLLFLHADCRLGPGALASAERILSRPGVVAGCFRQRIDAGHWVYRLIDAAATLRARILGVAYGDQGLFLRRQTFERIGGFPEVPLMEDMWICRKLRYFGRLALAEQHIIVSPRRWQRQGVVRQTLRNWVLTGLSAAGVSPQTLARHYPAVR